MTAGSSDDLAARLSAAEDVLLAGGAADALALAEPLAVHARALDRPDVLGCALLICAEALHLQARSCQAHAAAFEARALLHADTARQLRATIVLVAVCREADELARAAELARQGIDLAVRHGEHAMTLRLLHSLAQTLVAGDEYEEGVRCFCEALARHAQWPQCLPDHRLQCFAELALTRMRFGERLALAGQQHQARLQFEAAHAAALAPFVPRGEDDDALQALAGWVQLQAWRREDGAARRSAAAMMRIARRRRTTRKHLAQALAALGTVHLRAGRADRAISQQRRSFDILRDMRLSIALEHAVHRMAALHAAFGRCEQALHWQKQASAARATAQRDKRALQQQMARLERAASEQQARAHEALQHGERLLVLGRLLGQILHALTAPAQRVHASIAKALASLGPALSLGAQGSAGAESRAQLRIQLRTHLEHAVRDVDLAAALVQQLKLFSYRSTPKLSVLSLERALFDAWAGLGLHQPLAGWSLSMQPRAARSNEAAAVDVEADAQRLGILLKLLLMGMTSLGATQREPRAVFASTACTQPGTASLVLQCSSDHAVAAGPCWGRSLCDELAAEMDGQLTALGEPPHGFALRLPAVADPL